MSAKKTVNQVPKVSDEDLAIEPQVLERIAELDANVFRSIADRREASIEMGRAFKELKSILGHGKWQLHFEEVFVPRGITLRTAERYMKRAKRADSAAENDNLSNFKIASDEGAQEIREATDEAQTEVEAASNHSKSKKNSRHIYRLPLRMTANDIESTETLRKLPDWRKAERKIVHLLRNLFSKYGVATNDGGSH
jgi:hypothetical protein